jgi:hypothetical protein
LNAVDARSRSRDFIFGKELLGAVAVEFFLIEIGLCIRHCLRRCLDFLFAGSSQCKSKVGLAYIDAGLVDANFLLEVSIFKTRQQSALLYLLALLYRQVNDATLHFEAHETLMGFNVSGKC